MKPKKSKAKIVPNKQETGSDDAMPIQVAVSINFMNMTQVNNTSALYYFQNPDLKMSVFNSTIIFADANQRYPLSNN